jgi:serine protease Do
MFYKSERERINRGDDVKGDDVKNVIRRYNRVVTLLVAMCCLSIGIAVGSLVRGNAGAKSDDNRLAISYSPMAPDALSTAFSRVANQVEPAVVSVKVSDDSQHSPFPRETTGSGIIVQPDGYILTNQHVIDSAAHITVKLSDGKDWPAKLIGEDRETDLAVIKIDARQSLPFARMGDSEKLHVGDWVLAIGSPFGLDQTVTAGIISAKDRTTEQANSPAQRSTDQRSIFQRFLQTDAAINPGNSGGPLVNLAGEVIGINTMIATNTGNYNGIGFALPSSTAVDIYNQLVASGRVKRGFLGIELANMSPQYARLYGLEPGNGVVVNKVTSPQSPAARAGIRARDIIIGIDGQKVKDVRDLISRVAARPAGSIASITYMRDGQMNTVPVTLEERQEVLAASSPVESPDPNDPNRGAQASPGVAPAAPPGPDGRAPNGKQGLGLTVATISPQEAKARGMEGMQGAIVTFVDQGSLGYTNDLRPDDVVFEINRKEISSAEDFTRITRALKSGDDVVMRVMRKEKYDLGNQIVSEIVSFTMP